MKAVTFSEAMEELNEALFVANLLPKELMVLSFDGELKVAMVPKIFMDIKNRLNAMLLPVFFDSSFAEMVFETDGFSVSILELSRYHDPWLIRATAKMIRFRIYQALFPDSDDSEAKRIFFERFVDVPVRHGER